MCGVSAILVQARIGAPAATAARASGGRLSREISNDEENQRPSVKMTVWVVELAVSWSRIAGKSALGSRSLARTIAALRYVWCAAVRSCPC